jgi:hypothetical protein
MRRYPARGWLTLSILLSALVAGTAWADRPDQPGKTWVQSRPFQISAAAMSETYWNINTYKGCNFNASHPWQRLPDHPHGSTVILNSCQNNEVMIHPDIRGTHLHPGLVNFVNSISNASSDNAWYVMDEPPEHMFPGIANVVNWLKINRPNSLIYLGTADVTDAYIDPMIAAIQPDALSYCCYPFFETTTRLDWWWTGISRIRSKTLHHQMPFFTWIQAFAGEGWRIPTEADVRFLVYTSLTAGAKGLFYWIYDNDAWPSFTYALTDHGGIPNALYHQVQGINSEVAHLGNVLRMLHSDDLGYVRGRRNSFQLNPVPSGLSNWSYGAGGNTRITNVQVDSGQNGAERDGLIGLFSYDGPDPQYSGMQYFLLTNVYRDGSLQLTVTFDSSVTQLRRLDRGTGQWVVLYPAGGTLNFDLPAGTGELFGFPDTEPPSVPTDVQGTAVSWNSILLTWTASTDNVTVAGYRIYRNSNPELVGTSSTINFTDTGLQPQTTYSYRVTAYDAAQNESGQSAEAVATTLKRYAIADFDEDGDVDQEDFGFVQRCYSESPPLPLSGVCLKADLNGDGVVNQLDNEVFLSCLSGPVIPADPACGGFIN